jgi:hypothetical protein
MNKILGAGIAETRTKRIKFLRKPVHEPNDSRAPDPLTIKAEKLHQQGNTEALLSCCP